MDSLIEPSSLTGLEPDTIAISNVNLSLGSGAARVHILKDISLRVAPGEAIGLIGPSGSGKSTLLMVMAGLERPDSGEVVVNGTPFNALDEDALARALAPDPAILVADEPTGNLDEATGKQIVDLLFTKHDERGMTLVLVTHDTSLAQRCDRVVRLRSGRIDGYAAT